MKTAILTLCVLSIFFTSDFAQNVAPARFTNPLLPSGADPWVIYHNGYYYYTNSLGDRLAIRKTKNMTGLAASTAKTVWMPPVGTSYSKELWAPELHFLKGKWYLYFAADDGDNNHHRLYVLENPSADPTAGQWVFKGQLTDTSNKWAIDASVFENRGQLYLIWSGWEGDTNGQQNIYIAKMLNPYTVSSERVKLSSPDHDWEMHGDLGDNSNPPHVNVNEGPEMLMHGNKLFLVYSASGCWTDHYALGMLTADSHANLLDPASWKKSGSPVFKESVANSVYAPGHNSFFKSPDDKEDWIIYHANPKPGCGCGNQRSPRMQRFTWHKDGSPNFGIPVKAGIALAAPAK